MTPPSANLKAMFHLAGVGAATLPAIRLATGTLSGEIHMSKLVRSGMVQPVGSLRHQTYALTPAGLQIVSEWKFVLNTYPALQEKRKVA